MWQLEEASRNERWQIGHARRWSRGFWEKKLLNQEGRGGELRKGGGSPEKRRAEGKSKGRGEIEKSGVQMYVKKAGVINVKGDGNGITQGRRGTETERGGAEYRCT